MVEMRQREVSALRWADIDEGVASDRILAGYRRTAESRPRSLGSTLTLGLWREDVLVVAWQTVRRNGGTAGVDGETVADIESQDRTRTEEIA